MAIVEAQKGQLGLGSNVLTWDVIDKLKAVDTANIIKPLETKMSDNLTKQKDLTSITTMLNTFKSSVSSLVDETGYLKRKVVSSGSGSANLIVTSGVNEQTVKINVAQLAQQDTYQTKKFSMSNGNILSGTGIDNASFNINIGKQNYKIDVDSTTTLEGLASKINDATQGKVQAKVLNVGGKDPYRLVIQSKDSGEDNKINFSYVADSKDGANIDNSKKLMEQLGFYFEDATAGETLKFKKNEDLPEDIRNNAGEQIQTAQDAKFSYNGVEIVRNTNTIKDLMVGVTINLSKVDKPDEYSTLDIQQDSDSVAKDVQSLVDNYNNLMNNLNASTDYNAENNTSGVFQGVNDITRIKYEINQIINGVSSDGKSIQNFGLTLSGDGLLKLDTTKLNDALNSDFESFKGFFSAKTTYKNVNYTSKQISSGNINGTFKINGKEIEIKDTKDTNTKEENQNILLKAITDAKIENLTATLDKNGNLKLEGSAGENIKIEGDKDVLTKFGLETKDLEGTTEKSNGFFKRLDDALNDLVGNKGSLKSYENNLIEENKRMKAEKEKSQKSIDDKFKIMEQQFIAYDKIIQKINQQFSTLQSMIDTQLNSK